MLRLSLQLVKKPKFPVKTSGSQRLADISRQLQAKATCSLVSSTSASLSGLFLTIPDLHVLMYICLVLKKTLRPLSSSSRVLYLLHLGFCSCPPFVPDSISFEEGNFVYGNRSCPPTPFQRDSVCLSVCLSGIVNRLELVRDGNI